MQEETAKESSKSATGTIQRLDTEELPEINTSAEAIAFFAKHGQNTSIKFVHLVREADSDYKCFDPYALEVPRCPLLTQLTAVALCRSCLDKT